MCLALALHWHGGWAWLGIRLAGGGVVGCLGGPWGPWWVCGVLRLTSGWMIGWVWWRHVGADPDTCCCGKSAWALMAIVGPLTRGVMHDFHLF